jgi:hypothetical protein
MMNNICDLKILLERYKQLEFLIQKERDRLNGVLKILYTYIYFYRVSC